MSRISLDQPAATTEEESEANSGDEDQGAVVASPTQPSSSWKPRRLPSYHATPEATDMMDVDAPGATGDAGAEGDEEDEDGTGEHWKTSSGERRTLTYNSRR
jgi:hypothetical protein